MRRMALLQVEPPWYHARASMSSRVNNRGEQTRYYTRGEALSIGSSIRVDRVAATVPYLCSEL